MSQAAFDSTYLRQQIVGVDSMFDTPFGERLMVYCDYTASGRCLHFVESYLQSLQRVYANTHTEDDITGRSMSSLLHDAEVAIKESVNAGPDGRIVACGTGATGAIYKFQQIVGVSLAPATRKQIDEGLEKAGRDPDGQSLAHLLRNTQPVVFVGPYEHHSNEISWRQSLATTVQVELDDEGNIDLAHLETLLQDPRYQDRKRIGAFSAASNVTGVCSDVRKIASLLHKYDAIACFDFAACAPYVQIDMNPAPQCEGEDPSIDAVFISPHKFLGGPGSSGVLVFNQRIYDGELPPSMSAGGTVDYVGMDDQDFIEDIEEREKAGTPGVLQTLKAALAFQIKDRIGVDYIHAREYELTARAMKSWSENKYIEILGNPDPACRVGIISFNINDGAGRYLHHKFLTVLLNDLFGIQSRAGCSCAGPYGHRLLGIDVDRSERYRNAVAQGYSGLKPGWCRVGLHWVMDDAEADYVIDAVHFLASNGTAFLNLYDFDLATGTWTYRDWSSRMPRFSLDKAITAAPVEPAALPAAARREVYRHQIAEALRLAEKLQQENRDDVHALTGELGELQFFVVPNNVSARQ